MNFDRALLDRLRSARTVCVLTGAGMSAASGIPTFRDALTGLWAKYDPAQLATPEAFERDPALVTRWYDRRRRDVLRCQPNAGHLALSRWQEQLGHRMTLLTQNVDDLHERAGSRPVHHLHGSLLTWRDAETGEEQHLGGDAPLPQYPPRSAAGNLLRPGVVWFGEMLPEDVLAVAHDAMHQCDVFLAIGTSGQVYPVAGFAAAAKSAGAYTVEINPEQTPIAQAFAAHVRERSDIALPPLVELVLNVE